MYILWLASMTVNNNTDTAQNKNIALFAVFIVAAAVTIIILLLLSHRIDCIPLSTDVPCVCLSDLLYASTINYGWLTFRWNPFPKWKMLCLFRSIECTSKMNHKIQPNEWTTESKWCEVWIDKRKIIDNALAQVRKSGKNVTSYFRFQWFSTLVFASWCTFFTWNSLFPVHNTIKTNHNAMISCKNWSPQKCSMAKKKQCFPSIRCQCGKLCWH